jgi:D-sedoheptulose 7-phosphate isomerase
LKDGYSSSSIIERIKEAGEAGPAQEQNEQTSDIEYARRSLNEHREVFSDLLKETLPSIVRCGELISEAVLSGNKALLCGNGGSAADAQHIAAEFVGRYEDERRAFPAIALTVDTSALTAISNDYGYEKVFARQVEALAGPNDVLIAISTSGNSPNVLSAVMLANKIGCKTIGLTGANGKKLAGLCHAAVLAPSTRTSRIQEVHGAIGHIWCEMVDRKLREAK